MRTEKELWELVLSRQNLFRLGLCGWVERLYHREIITSVEFNILKRYMNKKLPYRRGSNFSWVSGKIQPRIDWINERIKQLEDESKTN